MGWGVGSQHKFLKLGGGDNKVTFGTSYNFIGKIGKMGEWELGVEQDVLWNEMIFCVFFLEFIAAKEFSYMARNRTLLNIRLLTIYSKSYRS